MKFLNMLNNSKHMSCDSCGVALASDWLAFLFQYGKNKDHAKEGGEGKVQEGKD